MIRVNVKFVAAPWTSPRVVYFQSKYNVNSSCWQFSTISNEFSTTHLQAKETIKNFAAFLIPLHGIYSNKTFPCIFIGVLESKLWSYYKIQSKSICDVLYVTRSEIFMSNLCSLPALHADVQFIKLMEHGTLWQ